MKGKKGNHLIALYSKRVHKKPLKVKSFHFF
jgi:hypothetical protein